MHFCRFKAKGVSSPYNALCLLIVRSLANNAVCGFDEFGNGTYIAEGINALCEALKSTTTLTSLE